MKANSNKVSFSLVKVSSKLSKGENRYRASVKSKGTYTIADICQAMSERVHGTESLATYKFYADLFEATVRDMALQGYRVKTSLFDVGLSISGSFDSLDGDFDAKRHKVRPTACVTKGFKKAAAGVTGENKVKHLKQARIHSLMDAVTKGLNEFVVGHEIHLQGINLGIDPDHPDEGVFLETAKGTRVASAVVMDSDPQNIKCRFETAIPAGVYTVRVISRSGASAEVRPSEATLSGVTVLMA